MELDKPIDETIEFRIDPASGVPTYTQLVRQVEHALRMGFLAPGDQLPKVKDVVASLAINPNTVLKAYRELEHKGLVAGRPGVGTFVQAAPDIVPLRDQRTLRRGLDRWLQQANRAGLDDTEIIAMVGAALHARGRREQIS